MDAPRPAFGGPRLRSFHDLQERRVQRILLVSSLYDSFILSEEGHLQETLLGQFLALQLSRFPDLVREPTRAAALARLESDRDVDVVIAGLAADAVPLAQALHERAGPQPPVIGLAYTAQELARARQAQGGLEGLERVFLWQGDVRLLLAIVKHLEDRWNADKDVLQHGVPVVLVVEDSIRFYSSFLPTIYAELFAHQQRCLSEDLNASQRAMRMRARPKVLLATTYEEAWGYFTAYREQVLGVISDFEFPREGRLDPDAGYRLCKAVRAVHADVRLVLQSSRSDNESRAEELGASFLRKGSPVLLSRLRRILLERFGFGDFTFRGPGGEIVARAPDLAGFREALARVPDETLVYHASRNHLSNWLKARTEFRLAERLRPMRVEDFADVAEMRSFLLSVLDAARRVRNRTLIADFDRARFDPEITFTRLGGGALGGKARGVAFANRVLHELGLDERFPGVHLFVPPTVVLGTEVFDEFLEYPRLRDVAFSSPRDAEVVARFQEAPFPRGAAADLVTYLQRVKHPLAVRSSSLLEDSLSQPFAGVYETWMLPNNDPDLEVRRQQLERAIKRVYASTFLQRAKTFLAMTPYRLEEEKMAVMVQALVGRRRGDLFYPDLAGVARSWNFYPEPGHAREDGVVAVALGMGRTVVDGSPCLRFNPRAPRQAIAFSTVRDALANAQRELWALHLDREAQAGGTVDLVRRPIDEAEPEALLAWLGSTWSPENDVVTDGVAREGVRLVSFAQVLKHGGYPLAEILCALLDGCSEGMGGPVELEFAGNLAVTDPEGRGRAEFAFLQMRPLALAAESEVVEIGAVDPRRVVCRSRRVLGNGALTDLRDLVVVDAARFERSKSREAAATVARFDAELVAEGRPYLLVGPGRWGSADPSLGIPVGWNHIAGARAVVECGFKDLRVEPSQGTHFFQNLTSCNVFYLTVNPDHDDGELDWDWLAAQPAEAEEGAVRRLVLERPLEVQVSGQAGEGVVLRPAEQG